MRYMITRSSIINSCNSDEKLHLIMTEKKDHARKRNYLSCWITTGNYARAILLN